MPILSLDEARSLAESVFIKCGASADNARITGAALIDAEADGQKGHGLSRIPSYAAQLKTGKVNGAAIPSVIVRFSSAFRIDADSGFAYPAIDLAIRELTPLAREHGVATAAIFRSHHFGQAGAHVERLAEKGLLAFIFGNSPKGIAFWGGKNPMMGTNPIAFAAPVEDGPPVVIDLALSVAARGKIIAAQKNNETIPEGWALDKDGNPTTDPVAALEGSMAPMGGAKGSALALMVEILAAALSGGQFGFEASSLFTGDGPPPALGHSLLVIDPGKLSGGAYFERMGVLMEAIAAEEGARLPGVSRLANREKSKKEGLSVSVPLYKEILSLTGAN